MDPGLGTFRMNRYSGTDETTNFHEYNDDGGGGIGGVTSFGRNLSTCFGGRGLNAGSNRMGAGRGYVNSRTQDEGYYTTADRYGSQFGLGNTGGLNSPVTRAGRGHGDYFSADNSNPSSFGGVSRGGMGRGRPPLLGDPVGFDDSGFSGSGRIGAARIGGTSDFRTSSASAQRNFNDRQYGQEYNSNQNQYEDEDLEPPPKYHTPTYSSLETSGPVFKRGGLRGTGGNRSNQGSRSGGGGSRYSNRSGGGSGNESVSVRDREHRQPNTHRSEALLPMPKSKSIELSSKKNYDKSVSTKIGVHLDITPPIFKEMTNRGLGDKVFIMIPKEAKSVMDVKIHVARLLGVDVYLVNFFINGFRIPENEDVEAFACISANALVQVVKPGYRPPHDLSKFNKTNEDKSAPSITSSHSSVEELESSNKQKSQTDNVHEAPDHDHVPVAISERKRRQNYMEPSLLEPPPRRSRQSNPFQSEAPSVTMLTPITKPIANKSPSKTVIEIVLSDDDDDQVLQVPSENKNKDNTSTPSTDSSSDRLVIEEGTGKTDEQKDKETNSSTGGGGSGLELTVAAEGEREVFTVEDEVGSSNSPERVPEFDNGNGQGQGVEQEQGQGPSATTAVNNKMDTQSQVNQSRNCDQSGEQAGAGSASENWLNADGQVVGRGRNRKLSAGTNISEVVDLSSSERDEQEEDDGSSTTFEEEEEFFTPTQTFQSIPIGVFRTIGEEEEAAVTSKMNSTQRKDCDQVGHENWDSEVTEIQEKQNVNLGVRPSLMNPCAKQPLSETNAHVSGQGEPTVASSLCWEQQRFAPTPKTDQEILLHATKTGTSHEESVSTTKREAEPMEVDNKPRRNTSPIDEVNQIKCGSIILYQIMERAVHEDEKMETEHASGPRQLSDVKCCKVIGRSGLKLTLQPMQDGEIALNSKKETESESDFPTQKKFVFVDFKDMINLQEVVQEAS